MGLNKKKMATMAAATAAFVSSVLPVGAAQAAECMKGEKCYKEDYNYVITHSTKDGGSYKDKAFYDRYISTSKKDNSSYRDRGYDKRYYSCKGEKCYKG